VSRRFVLLIAIFGITLLSAGVVWFTNGRAASDPTGLADSTPQGPGLERYVDSVGGFFFDYPTGLKLTVTDNGDEHDVFGDASNGDTRLMVVAYPYTLDEPLTGEMIRAQFGHDITSPIDRIALPSATTAFLFQRTDTPLGPTRDALFVHGATAYQVSAAEQSQELFDTVLETWRFTSPTTQ
jgi:hypothetical protein